MTGGRGLGDLVIQAVGGPTAVLEFGGMRLITDPTFDPPRSYDPRPGVTLTKTEGPALTPERLGPIDVVLLSHDQHVDNLDVSGRDYLTRVPRVLTTVTGAERLGANAMGMKPWSSLDLQRPGGEALTVTAVPAQHGPDGTDHLTGPVIGFVLTREALPSLYVSGDNASVEVVRLIADRLGRIELAVLFVGGAKLPQFDGYLTLSSDRAVEASSILGACAVIPVHYRGWSHFSQGIESLRFAFDAAGIGNRLIVPELGSAVIVPASGHQQRSRRRRKEE
jgi:L-ascorbate metabolism protein UlaG (beta-lactamase superfamily)